MWINVTLDTDAAHADALSDALMGVGAISVSVEDAQAGTEQETPQFGEPDGRQGMPVVPLWAHSRVVALFEPSANLNSLIEQAVREAGLTTQPSLTITEVAEQDWVRLTQSQFDPIEITPKLWIVPSWHAAPDPTAINLVLDPGLAFGTGSHPTTWLCLHWLSENVRRGATVLDYGCGSGILAIAAAKLGAGPVKGVDIDDNALIAAGDNARQNQVDLALQHTREPLQGQFDIVVANILTNPLCALAPLLSARVAPQGRLVLSGVLAEQAEQVIAAYAPWLALRVGATRDGWVRLENAAC